MAKAANILRHRPVIADQFSATASTEERVAARQFMERLERQASARRSLLEKEGRIIPMQELTCWLKTSPEQLRAALASGRIFSLETNDGRELFPSFFTDPTIPRCELEAISMLLVEVPDWGKWQFFTTPKFSLCGKTPLEAIALGEFERVRISAKGFAER